MQDERMSNELSRKVELSWLLGFYGGMLTEKQRLVLTLHCEEDLSLGEIAREAGISRQGVHDMLSRAAQRLFDLEEHLGMAARFQRMESGLERCSALLKEQRYEEAARVIDGLLTDQEENNGL